MPAIPPGALQDPPSVVLFLFQDSVFKRQVPFPVLSIRPHALCPSSVGAVEASDIGIHEEP